MLDIQTDNFPVPLGFRYLRNEDRAFIFHSWLESYKYYRPKIQCNLNEPAILENLQRHSNFTVRIACDRPIPLKLYRNGQKWIINNILKRSDGIIAYFKDGDTDEMILGYMIYEQLSKGSCLHYLYVGASYREKGLASSFIRFLIGFSPIYSCTHMTNQFKGLAQKYKMIYNPYLAHGEGFISEERIK